MPAWAQALVDHYSDPVNWRTSKKGNPTIWIAGRNVTIWRSSSGRWSWVIGAHGRSGQSLWSEHEFADADDARRDDRDALMALAGA